MRNRGPLSRARQAFGLLNDWPARSARLAYLPRYHASYHPPGLIAAIVFDGARVERLMSIDELIEKLKSLPQPELQKVLNEVGQLHSSAASQRPASSTGLTPGLLHGLVTHISDDFDDELPESFWSGQESES